MICVLFFTKSHSPPHYFVLFCSNKMLFINHTLKFKYQGSCLNFSYLSWTAVAQWLRCCVTNRKDAGSIPAGVSEFFVYIKSFRSHYGPGVDSASNRNEYQEYFPGGKDGRYVRLTTLPPSCAVVTKSGNLNFLEASGPLKACNGTDLPFYHL